jgi:hypothetical protein
MTFSAKNQRGNASDKMLIAQKLNRELAGFLALLIVFSPMSSLLNYFPTLHGELLYYCCTNPEETCSLNCTCGCCPGDNSEDESLSSELLPVSHCHGIFLTPSFPLADNFPTLENAYKEVLTRPPIMPVFVSI